jgi:hypothetical protein
MKNGEKTHGHPDTPNPGLFFFISPSADVKGILDVCLDSRHMGSDFVFAFIGVETLL